jgi:branched-chain amino acid transport system permease protein
VLEKFLQTLMDGLAVGSLYALIALGYTMVYGILKFINFAHSDIFVLGAWVSYATALLGGYVDLDPSVAGVQAAAFPGWILYALAGVTILTLAVSSADYARSKTLSETSRTLMLGTSWAWACVALAFTAKLLNTSGWSVAGGGVILLVSMLTCGLVGFTLERVAYKPLRKAPRLNVLITAIGVSLLLQNVGQLNWMFGTRPQGMPILLPDSVLAEIGGIAAAPSADGSANWEVQPVRVRLLDVIAAGTALVLMFGLDRLVFHSKIGRAMRAVSFSERNAALMGIPVDRVISFTFVLGSMLAAAAGFLYGQKYSKLGQTADTVWVLLGLKAFVAAVVGGIGNIRGAMLGGILIGLLEFFGVAYFIPQLRDVYVFGVLIVVLLVRPGGILGSTAIEKV